MTYWDIQTKLILELGDLGYTFKLRDRIPIFKVYMQLMKLAKKKPNLEEQITNVLDLLEYQLALRQAGLEPPLLTKDRYKSGT